MLGESESVQVSLVDAVEGLGQVALCPEVDDLESGELGAHHEGGGALGGFVVPSGEEALVGGQMLSENVLDEVPDE